VAPFGGKPRLLAIGALAFEIEARDFELYLGLKARLFDVWFGPEEPAEVFFVHKTGLRGGIAQNVPQTRRVTKRGCLALPPVAS
ncbi:MAG: hypothetical protein AAFR53_15525, partial [Pseudomonadota bacterium]